MKSKPIIAFICFVILVITIFVFIYPKNKQIITSETPSSDTTVDIEKDLNSVNINDLDKEMNEIEAEIN